MAFESIASTVSAWLLNRFNDRLVPMALAFIIVILGLVVGFPTLVDKPWAWVLVSLIGIILAVGLDKIWRGSVMKRAATSVACDRIAQLRELERTIFDEFVKAKTGFLGHNQRAVCLGLVKLGLIEELEGAERGHFHTYSLTDAAKRALDSSPKRK